MRAKEFHAMSRDELNVKLGELKAELFNLRFRHATNQLDNPMVIAICKKDIARAMTILKEKERQEAADVKSGAKKA